MYLIQRIPVALIALLCIAESVPADEIPTQLGQRGEVLLSEDFSDSSVLKAWTGTTGKREIADGALRVHELAADKHAAAFRYRLPVRDCAVQFEFQFERAKFMHFGFDPAPGQLKKKGHLFSVVITPENWSLLEHNDKAQSSSRAKTHIKEAIMLEHGKHYRVLIESKGEKVVATLEGVGRLQATSPDFHVKKPGLVFRVGGEDNQFVTFDNVRVWELK